MKYNLLIISLLCFFFSCKNEKKAEKYTANDAEYLHRCEKKLTDIIILDIFTPPVASRIYVYPSIAAYEVAKFAKPNIPSISAQLKGFSDMPKPENGKEYDYTIAAIKAFCTTAKKVVFSAKEIEVFEKKTLDELKDRCTNEEIYNRSVAFGEQTAAIVIKRLMTDMYKETRGMERYEVKPVAGRWVPTLPDYADGIEPHWRKMKPLVMDSAAACKPVPPILYNDNKNSLFWKELLEVYEGVNKISAQQDEIVRFWDDNPFVSRTKGHLMFQEKKMTPGGHWMAICRIFSRYKKIDFVETARAYALTSTAIFDGFISCWDEKYRSNKVRPETVIKDKINKDWQPYLVTPPFPAYTSGHSTVSAAAAEAMTTIFGDNIAFTDTTEKEFGLPVRTFTSFRAAAIEASYSRLTAGIHYRSDCEMGNLQGKKVGQLVVNKIASIH